MTVVASGRQHGGLGGQRPPGGGEVTAPVAPVATDPAAMAAGGTCAEAARALVLLPGAQRGRQPARASSRRRSRRCRRSRTRSRSSSSTTARRTRRPRSPTRWPRRIRRSAPSTTRRTSATGRRSGAASRPRGSTTSRSPTAIASSGSSTSAASSGVSPAGTADAVVGYRIRRADPLVRTLYARAYRLANRIFFGLKVRDVDCACKLFTRRGPGGRVGRVRRRVLLRRAADQARAPAAAASTRSACPTTRGPRAAPPARSRRWSSARFATSGRSASACGPPRASPRRGTPILG